MPDAGETVVEDLLRGPVAFPNASYDDFVIARGDGSVLYNFAVAVDDAEMGITEVVRGDDHLSNTPKQLLVLAALGHEPPRYAHLPLLHGPDGKKLSKRHGAASVQELRDSGYLPAAVRNYLALLGWGTDDDTTLMSTEELVRRFRVADVGKSAAIFDEKKLRWLNGRFMREMPLEMHGGRRQLRQPDERLAACAIARRKRRPWMRSGRSALRGAMRRSSQEKRKPKDLMERRSWPADPLPLRAAGGRPEGLGEGDERGVRGMLEAAAEALQQVEPFEPEAIEAALAPLLERFEVKPGKLYQPIRVAITGSSVSPGIFESLAALGSEETLKRPSSGCRMTDGQAEVEYRGTFG